MKESKTFFCLMLFLIIAGCSFGLLYYLPALLGFLVIGFGIAFIFDLMDNILLVFLFEYLAILLVVIIGVGIFFRKKRREIKDVEKVREDVSRPWTVERYINDLKRLRDDYSDEIPEKMISGMDKNRKFKVRRNWWQGFFSLFHLVFEDLDVTDVSIKKEVDALYEQFQKKLKVWRDSHYNNDLHKTTREEIDKANNLLTRTIAYLENIKNGGSHE